MFGHFVERMLMGGGGGSSGGGGGGRDTPGSPNAADGRRGSSMGSDGGIAGGSSRGGGGGSTNPGRPGGESGERSLSSSGPGRSSSSAGRASDSYDRSNSQIDTGSRVGGGSTNPGRPGGESGERSLTVGSESISGSGNARSSFSFNTRSPSSSLSVVNRRSPTLQAPQASFRAQRKMETESFGVDDLSPVLMSKMETPSWQTPEYEQAMADRMNVQPATRDREEAKGYGIMTENQPEMDTGWLGIVPGGILALGQNIAAGRKTANQLTELEQESNLPDTFFSDDANAYAAAYGAERLANVPVLGSVLGDNQAAEKAMLGAYNPPEPNRPEGGGGDKQPYIPPQLPTNPQAGNQQRPRGFAFGKLGDYSSYARRVFSRV